MPQHRITYSYVPATATTGNANAGAPDTLGSQQGWREIWYDASVISDAQALDLGYQLWLLRRPLLARGWRLKDIRVSQFPLTRLAAKRSVTPADGFGTYGTPVAPGNSEQAYDALIINVTAANGHQRAFSMRGIGVGVVTAGNIYAAPPPFATAVVPWANYLVANFDLRTVISGDRLEIVTVFTDPIGAHEFTDARPGVFFDPTVVIPLAGQLIRISGVLGLAGLNGQWTVDRVGTAPIAGVEKPFIRLRPKRGRRVVGEYVDGGYAVVLSPVLSKIETVAQGDGTSRRTGGSPSRPRGRRSNRQS